MRPRDDDDEPDRVEKNQNVNKFVNNVGKSSNNLELFPRKDFGVMRGWQTCGCADKANPADLNFEINRFAFDEGRGALPMEGTYDGC